MSDNSNITRDDLVAAAYNIYIALHNTLGKEPLTPQEFGINCENAFKEFPQMSEK